MTNSTPKLVSGAVILTLWLTFGLGTILNSIALDNLNQDRDISAPVNLPDNMQEAIWLVMGLWIAGYVGGLLSGLDQRNAEIDRSVIFSAILGYEIAISFRLLLINYFPDVPHNAFQEVLDILVLDQVPTYPAFLILTLLIGPVLITLAVITGSLLAQEIRQFTTISLQFEPRTLIVGALLPLLSLLLLIGIQNYDEADVASGVSSEFGQPTIAIRHLDILANPLINILLAVIVGILIGAVAANKSRLMSGLAAAGGLMIHVLIVVLFQELLSMNALNTDDLLALLLIDYIDFSIFWFLPPLAAGLLGYLTHFVRDLLLAPSPQPNEQLLS